MSELLPPAPRKLRSGYVGKRLVGGALGIVAAIAVAGAYGYWQWGSAQAILHDQALWARGEVVAEAAVDGRETSRSFILNSYDLKVRYLDEASQLHEREVEFDLLFVSVDQDRPTLVKFDRATPDDFVLSWAAESTTARWASFGFMALAGIGLIGGSLAFLGVGAIRSARAAEAAASRGIEVECPITGFEPQVVQGKATDNMVYRFRLPEHVTPDGDREVIIPAKEGGPILLDGGTKLLALVDPAAPKIFLVPRRDLSPLDVDAESKRQYEERAARRA